VGLLLSGAVLTETVFASTFTTSPSASVRPWSMRWSG